VATLRRRSAANSRRRAASSSTSVDEFCTSRRVVRDFDCRLPLAGEAGDREVGAGAGSRGRAWLVGAVETAAVEARSGRIFMDLRWACRTLNCRCRRAVLSDSAAWVAGPRPSLTDCRIDLCLLIDFAFWPLRLRGDRTASGIVDSDGALGSGRDARRTDFARRGETTRGSNSSWSTFTYSSFRPMSRPLSLRHRPVCCLAFCRRLGGAWGMDRRPDFIGLGLSCSVEQRATSSMISATSCATGALFGDRSAMSDSGSGPWPLNFSDGRGGGRGGVS